MITNYEKIFNKLDKYNTDGERSSKMIILPPGIHDSAKIEMYAWVGQAYMRGCSHGHTAQYSHAIQSWALKKSIQHMSGDA